MKKKYDHIFIEKKWQKFWEDNNIFKTLENDNEKEKYYVLDMFPYPSGEGLHVGHPEGYTATDIIARYKRMKGYNVLHPIGFDAFGLPAEQYAINTGNNPSIFTNENIKKFKKQIKSLGFSYDWDREINTSDPKYYKWTQWIFIKMYENNLAELKEIPVNWCPELNSVLSNEEVIDGYSERGKYPVYRIPMKQWVLKITNYADRLLDDLEDLDWPESIKELQRNWIGKETGHSISLPVNFLDIDSIEIFISNVSLLYFVEFIVISPENIISKKLSMNNKEIENLINSTRTKSTFDRLYNNEEKIGVSTDLYVEFPFNNKKIPIYIGDYIINNNDYHCGIPCFNKNDQLFANKNNIYIMNENFYLDGNFFKFENERHFFHGKEIFDEDKKVIKKLKENNFHVKPDNKYKLHDWIFSRQRYWGEPFPIIFFEDGTIVIDKNLPIMLPKANKIKQSKNMESPLVNFDDWVNVDGEKYNKPGVKGKRDTNTMPQWAASSWYYLRYIDPFNDNEIGEFKKLEKWLPVDLYIGGKEHAVLHLLYVRFWHKVLYDLKIVPYKEPIKKLVNQGMILGDDNTKMSKSKGNVVNPDEIIKKYGADTLRLYEMFLGPIESDKPWNTSSIKGARKFIERLYNFFINDDNITLKETPQLDYIYNYNLKKITQDIENLRFNTAISQAMIFLNELYKVKIININYAKNYIKILNPIIPHVTEEIWEKLGEKELISYSSWPKYDEQKIVKKLVKYVIQINGKLKKCIDFSLEDDKEYIINFALEELKNYINGKEIKKIIFIKDKIVNIVL